MTKGIASKNRMKKKIKENAIPHKLETNAAFLASTMVQQIFLLLGAGGAVAG